MRDQTELSQLPQQSLSNKRFEALSDCRRDAAVFFCGNRKGLFSVTSQNCLTSHPSMFLVFDEKFTAYAEIDSVVIDLNGEDDLVFPLEVGISSDAVVEGATLALVYANDDFVAKNKGAVTASCTIAF